MFFFINENTWGGKEEHSLSCCELRAVEEAGRQRKAGDTKSTLGERCTTAIFYWTVKTVQKEIDNMRGNMLKTVLDYPRLICTECSLFPPLFVAFTSFYLFHSLKNVYQFLS